MRLNIKKIEEEYQAVEEETTKQFLALAASEMERIAVELVPVDTGNLKGSITSWTDEFSAYVGAGFTKAVSYAKFVEYGTAKMRPQPFLRPALFEVSSKATKMFTNLFQKNINKSNLYK